MKKKQKFYIILVLLCLFILLFIIYFFIPRDKQYFIWEEVLYRWNEKYEESIKKNLKEAGFKNIWSNFELGNHMNITIEEKLIYWSDNGELLSFFNKKWYNILYLYSCEKINGYHFKCPLNWFYDFTGQFTSTWNIQLVKWKNSYFKNWDDLIYLYSSKNIVNFIKKNHEK